MADKLNPDSIIDTFKFNQWINNNLGHSFLTETSEEVKFEGKLIRRYLYISPVRNQFKAAIETAEADERIPIPDENGQINSNIIDKQRFYDWVDTTFTFGNTNELAGHKWVIHDLIKKNKYDPPHNFEKD